MAYTRGSIQKADGKFDKLCLQMQKALERATMRDLVLLQESPQAREMLAEAIVGLHRVAKVAGIQMEPVPAFVLKWIR